MVVSVKSFQDVVEFFKKAEVLKKQGEAKAEEKKARPQANLVVLS